MDGTLEREISRVSSGAHGFRQKPDAPLIRNGAARGVDYGRLENVEIARLAKCVGEPSQLLRSPTPSLPRKHLAKCGNCRPQPADANAHLVDAVWVARQSGCLITHNLVEAMVPNPLEGFSAVELRGEHERLRTCGRAFPGSAAGKRVTALCLALRVDPQRGCCHQLLRDVIERRNLAALQFELDLADRERPLLVWRDDLTAVDCRLDPCARCGAQLDQIALNLRAEHRFQPFDNL